MQTLLAIIKNKALRKKILLTLFFIAIVRILQNIPVPLINLEVLSLEIEKIKENIGADSVSNINIYTGKALERLSIGFLGIIPYITASIIMQLCTPLFPKLKKMQRESDEGLRKYIQISRYLTVIIAIVQSYAASSYILSNAIRKDIPEDLFIVFCVTITTAMTIVIMWLGEKISHKGIGNGASIIITANILSSFPQAVFGLYGDLIRENLDIIKIIFIIILFITTIIGTIILVKGERRIPIQYMVRQNFILKNNSNFLPLKVNYAGVMPIIFASPVLLLLSVVIKQLKWSFLAPYVNYGNTEYIIIFAIIIFVFTFLWVAMQFDSMQISDDLNRSGGIIPGHKPGIDTANFLDETMTKITTAGAIFLVIIAILPMTMHKTFNTDIIINQFFGGTSLLIIVGVVIQTVEKIQSQLLQENYSTLQKKSLLSSRKE